MYGPHNVDRRMRLQNGEQALYLLHRGGHYDVVLQTGQSGVAASAKTGGKRQSGNAGEPPSKRLKADWGVPPCEDGKPFSKQPCSVYLRQATMLIARKLKLMLTDSIKLPTKIM